FIYIIYLNLIFLFIKLSKPTQIYNISLHDALSIFSLSDIDWGFLEDDFYIKSPSLKLSKLNADIFRSKVPEDDTSKKLLYSALLDRKSTRLNSSHVKISYAVFCLKKNSNYFEYISK